MPGAVSKLVYAVAALATLGFALGPHLGTNDGDPVTVVAASDHTMNAAQREARSLVAQFLDQVFADGPISGPGELLKVAFPVVTEWGPTVEVIWVGEFGRAANGGFEGHLANAPQNMPGMALGDVVAFTDDMIRDWTFPAADGRGYGHFTTRVIAARIEEETRRKEYLSLLTPDPLPETW